MFKLLVHKHDGGHTLKAQVGLRNDKLITFSRRHSTHLSRGGSTHFSKGGFAQNKLIRPWLGGGRGRGLDTKEKRQEANSGVRRRQETGEASTACKEDL